MIAGITGGVAALGVAKFFTTSFEDTAAGVIREELHFLKLHESGLRKFVSDYAKAKSRLYKLTMKGYSLFGIDSRSSGKMHQLVSAYLLSSDFFAKGMDERREVQYVQLYDPYTRPCTHPFSHIHYPAKA